MFDLELDLDPIFAQTCALHIGTLCIFLLFEYPFKKTSLFANEQVSLDT